MNRIYDIGEPVIYRKTKVSSAPGARAKQIHAARNGENYTYNVDKFWRVSSFPENGQIELVTRTGKKIQVAQNDERLRKASFLERFVFSKRFPDIGWLNGNESSASNAQ